MEEDRNGRSGLLQNSEPDLTKSGKGGNESIESEKKDNPCIRSGRNMLKEKSLLVKKWK
jgi:hypothetical protein